MTLAGRNRKIWAVLRRVLGRMGGLYLALALVSVPLVRYRVVIKKARATTLSRLIPDFRGLIAFSEGRGKLSDQQWEDYQGYFRRLARHLPDDGHAEALWGYCAFHLGDTPAALRSYRRAAELLPGHFAYRYNLGALLARLDRHREALEEFRAAQDCDARSYIRETTSSRVLFPLFAPARDEEVILRLRMNLKQGLEKCFLAAVVSQYQIGGYAEMIRLAHTAVQAGCEHPAEFFYYAGVAAYGLGQADEARAFLQKCLELVPDHARARAVEAAMDRSRQPSGAMALSPRDLERLAESAGAASAPGQGQDILQLY